MYWYEEYHFWIIEKQQEKYSEISNFFKKIIFLLSPNFTEVFLNRFRVIEYTTLTGSI